MNAEWPRQTLRNICTLISGQHIESTNYNTEGRGVGYLTGPSDFGAVNPAISKWTEHPKVIANSGDILITVKGSGVGKLNLLDQDGIAISRQLMALRVTGAYPGFVYAVLGSRFEHFQSLSTGAAIPGISREQILTLQIALPLISEQQRIVAILDEAFEGIATAKASAEKNALNARKIFDGYLAKLFADKTPSWIHTTIGASTRFIDYRGKTPNKTSSGLRLITAKNVKMDTSKRVHKNLSHQTLTTVG